MLRVIIDGNSVGHAAFQTTPLYSGDIQTQAVYGFLRSLRSILVAHPESLPTVLWDGASWRKGIADEYKANRSDDDKKREARARYKQQAPYIRKALAALGVTQIIAGNLEADDLAAILSEKIAAAGEDVLLVTGDEDWIQLVGPNVRWADHRVEDKKVDHWNFKEFTGVDTIDQFVQMKALQGDDSDNLKGCGGIGVVKALEIMTIWGSVEQLFADPTPAATFIAATGKKTLPKAYQNFLNNENSAKENYDKNYKLMRLSAEYFPKPERLVVNRGELNREAFKQICMELGFRSLSGEPNLSTYLLPFQRHSK